MSGTDSKEGDKGSMPPSDEEPEPNDWNVGYGFILNPPTESERDEPENLKDEKAPDGSQSEADSQNSE